MRIVVIVGRRSRSCAALGNRSKIVVVSLGGIKQAGAKWFTVQALEQIGIILRSCWNASHYD